MNRILFLLMLLIGQRAVCQEVFTQNGKMGVKMPKATLEAVYDSAAISLSQAGQPNGVYVKRGGRWAVYFEKEQRLSGFDFLQPLKRVMVLKNGVLSEPSAYYIGETADGFSLVTAQKTQPLPMNMYLIPSADYWEIVLMQGKEETLIKVPQQVSYNPYAFAYNDRIYGVNVLEGAYVFYNIKDQTTRDVIFDSAPYFLDSLLVQMPNYSGAITFYDNKGEKIAQTQKSYFRDYSYGAQVSSLYQNGKFIVYQEKMSGIKKGLVDIKGNELLPCEYTDIFFLKDDYLWALKPIDEDDIYSANRTVTVYHKGNKVNEFTTSLYYYQYGDSALYTELDAGLGFETLAAMPPLYPFRNADGYLGTVNVRGEQIVPATYSSIKILPNDRIAGIKDDYLNFDWLDYKGNKIKSINSEEVYVYDVRPLTGDVFAYGDAETVLFIDKAGNKVGGSEDYIAIIVASDIHQSSQPFFIAGHSNGSYAWVNSQTWQEVPLSLASIPASFHFTDKGTVWIYCTQDVYVIDLEGKVINHLPLMYPEAGNTNTAPFCFDAPKTYLYLSGNKTITEYADVFPFYNIEKEQAKLYFWVKEQQDKWILMDSLGNKIPTKEEYLCPAAARYPNNMLDARWACKSDNKNMALIDLKTGKEWWSGEVTHCYPVGRGVFVKTADQSTFWIDIHTQKAMRFNEPVLISPYYALVQDVNHPYSPMEIYEPHYVNDSTYYFIAQDTETRKYGIIDNRNRRVTSIVYDSLGLSYYAIEAIKDDKYYVFNRDSFYESPTILVDNWDGTYINVPTMRFVNNWQVMEEIDPKNDGSDDYVPVYLIKNMDTGKKMKVLQIEPFSLNSEKQVLVQLNEKTNMWGVLDEKGEWAIKPTQSIEAIYGVNYNDSNPYNKKLKKYEQYTALENGKGYIVFKNGNFGFVNDKYKETIPLLYSDLMHVQGDTFLAKVGKQTMLLNGKHEGIYLFDEQWTVWNINGTRFYGYSLKNNPFSKGLISPEFNVLTQPIYQDISLFSYIPQETIFYTAKGDSSLLLDVKGRVLASTKYSYEGDWQMAEKLKNIYFNKGNDPNNTNSALKILQQRFGNDWLAALSYTTYTRYFLTPPYLPEEALLSPFLIFEEARKQCFDAKGNKVE